MDVDVRLHDVTMEYGATRVLHEINLDVYKGEFLSLLGPSGCGKTTTLNLIAGFNTSTSGTIMLRGRVVNDLPPHRRDLGMVFQNYALFPHLSVFDNVAFGLTIRKMKKGQIATRVEEVLTLVQLEGLNDRAVRQLSGGQQQRVAIARALAINPLVLLMDEPLSNLDAKLRRQMRVELRRIQRQVGITTIFVTHDQEEALTMSDRLVVMNRGRIEQIGTPGELYRHPETPFVAQFLGHPNFLYGNVTSRTADDVTIQTGAHAVQATANGALNIGDRVAIVLRAESVTLQREAPINLGNIVAGTIDYTVYLGTNAEYEVVFNDGVSIRVVEQIRSGVPTFETGEKVFATWAPEDAIVLPMLEGGFGEDEEEVA